MQVRHHKHIVLGAGISGLCAAVELHKAGEDVLILEKAPLPGGVLKSVVSDGFVWDRAAHTIAADKEVFDFFKRHNLSYLIQEPTAVAKVRQLVIDDKIQTVESHPFKILTASFLSTGAKFRIIKELFKRRIDLENPTVEEFFHYHFGEEITRNTISAVFSGIYAGDIAKMEMKSVMSRVYDAEQEKGSVIRAMVSQMKVGPRRKIIGIKGGMQELSLALSTRIGDAVYNCNVSNIRPYNNGYEIITDSGLFRCDNLISTLPAYALGPLVEESSREFANLLRSVEYSPLLLAHISFQKRDVDQQAFGFLCSQYDPSNLKGAIYNSLIFPERAKEGYESCSLFIKYSSGNKIEEEISVAVEKFRKLCGIEGVIDIVAHTAWDQAIPQFNKPYFSRKKRLLDLANFHLSGSFISGVSVTDCIKYNVDLVSEL